MTVIARRFAAEPRRTSSETWAAITATICAEDSGAANEFKAVAGTAAALIADEALRQHPLVIEGGGVRVRLYCIYGEAALDDQELNESFLAANPFGGDGWRCHLPCKKTDLGWVTRTLQRRSARFFAYDMNVGLGDTNQDGAAATGNLTINAEAFKKL